MNNKFMPNMILLNGKYEQGSSGTWGGGTGEFAGSYILPDDTEVYWADAYEVGEYAGYYDLDGNFYGQIPSSDWTKLTI